MGNEPKASAEEGFREALKDTIGIISKLGPHCGTFDELVGMATLALENDGQLRLLMREVSGQALKR